MTFWMEPGFKITTTCEESGDALKILVESWLLIQGLGYKVIPGFGTLLGLYRDNQIIPHDTDVDMNIFLHHEMTETDRMIVHKKLSSAGYNLVLGDAHQLAYRKEGSQLILDVCFFHIDGDYYVCPHQVKPFKIHMDKVYDVEAHLANFYGDWKTPLDKSAKYLQGDGCK